MTRWPDAPLNGWADTTDEPELDGAYESWAAVTIVLVAGLVIWLALFGVIGWLGAG